MYLNDWKEGGFHSMAIDFGKDPDSREFAGIEVLIASYTYENYSGDAFVLYRKNGNLYEVNGGHCSCFGLEDQWEPEETSVAALRARFTRYGPPDEYAKELKNVLNEIDKTHQP
jgi:hypothetical protein